MKKSELATCLGGQWEPVKIRITEGFLPVTRLTKDKVFVCGDNEPLFGNEVMEELPNMNEEFEVVLDI